MAKKKQDKTGEKAKMGVDSLLNTPDTKCDSTLALTRGLHGYYSKMALGTVKYIFNSCQPSFFLEV